MTIRCKHNSARRVAGVLLLSAGIAFAGPPESATKDPSGQTLSDAEKTWQALVARVPDLGAMGLRHHQREPLTRVPMPSELTPARRLCRYERDLQSNVMRRRCYSAIEHSHIQRQSQVTPTMYVGGVRQ